MSIIALPEQSDPRAEYVKGLRALADILEAHPEVPLPYQGSSPQYARLTFHFLNADDPRGEMAAARRALGVPLDKDARDDAYFDLKGSLHGLHFTMTAFRAAVCERVVTGTREVEIDEPDPQALAAVPKVKRTVTVEDVEWQCHPILADAERSGGAR